MSSLVDQTIATSVTVAVGGGLTLLTLFISNLSSEKKSLKAQKNEAILRLQSARLEVATAQRELRADEASILAYMRDAEILEKMPRSHRPSNYSKRLDHAESEIKYYRDLAEQRKIEMIKVMKDFHALVVEIDQIFSDDTVTRLCNAVLEQGMPPLETPPASVDTLEKIDAWIEDARNKVITAINDALVGAIDRLLGEIKRISNRVKTVDKELRIVSVWKAFVMIMKD